jgi:hypothetical protein
LTHSGPVNISNNPKLVSITGFNLLLTTNNFIGNAPGTLSIRDNETLTTLGGFDVLRAIADVRIVNNKSLMSLDGFTSLTGVVGFLEISDNAALKSINGFNNLTGIGTFSKFYPNGGLLIIKNPSLESFDGLSSLKSVGGDHIQVTVSNNAALKNIDGLSSLTYIAGTFHQSLNVSNNPVLEDCDGLFPYFSTLGHDEVIRLVNLGIIIVSGNGAGCTVEDILNSAAAVVGYDIVDTSGKFVRHLNEGDILYLDDLKCKGQTIVANTTGQIGSVKFDVNNTFFMMQNAFPYTLTGDNYGTYFKPWIPQAGAYTLTATPYSKSDAGGVAGKPLTIHFTVKPGTVVVSYDIVDTSGKVARHLNEGDILYLDDLKSNGQTIVANTTGEIGSVKFDLNNKFFMMQNAFPYTLTGDNYGTYFQPWIPHAGAYTLTATPYSQSDAGGCAGRPLTIHFTVKPKTLSAVVSYDIVNTSGKFVRRLNEGDILYLDDLKGKGQTIVANTTGQIGSVKFDLNNAFFMMQNDFPYTLTGDNYGTYFKPWIPQAGAYALTATPYYKSNAGGRAGRPLTIHLTVVEKNKGVAARMIGTGPEEDSPEGDGVSGLTIYPVPVDNELFVKMNDTVGKDAVLSILTIQGLSVYEGTYSKSSSISTVDLKPGVYVLQVVSNNGFQRVVKFIKK